MTGSARELQTERAAPAARDAAWSTLGTVVGLGLRTVSVVVCTRVLGAAGFGTYTLARVVTTVLGVVAGLGLSPGLLPFVAAARRDGDAARLAALVRTAWRMAALAALACAALAWLLAPWLASRAFEEPELAPMLRVLAVLIVPAALATTTLAVAQACQRVRASVWIDQVLAASLTLLALLATWWLGLGVAGVLAATLLGPLVGLGVAAALVARLVPGVAHAQPPAASRVRAGELLAASWPNLGASLLWLGGSWLDVLLLGVFRDAREVGIYGGCTRLATVVVLVHESVGPVFAARLEHLRAQGDPVAIGRLYRQTGRWSLWSALAVGWMVMLWGRELLGLMGAEFVEGLPVLGVLVLEGVLLASSGMSTRMLVLTGRQRSNFLNAVLMVACCLALGLAWIPDHGALGAAAATCATIALGKVLQVVEVRLYHGVLPWSTRGLLALPATGALAALAWALRAPLAHSVGVWVSAAGFGVACVLLYVLLGADEEERAALAALRRRWV